MALHLLGDSSAPTRDGKRAKLANRALRTFWFAGLAKGATVVDHDHGIVGPDFGGENLHDVVFDFDGVFVFGEAEAAVDAATVRVYYDTGYAEPCAEQHVGGLSPDAI